MTHARKHAKTPQATEAIAKPKSQAEVRPVAARESLEWPLLVLPVAAFFLVYYLCLWKRVDVQLIYHGGGVLQDFPSFYWGWEFARAFQTHPGGLVEYVSAFMAQSLYSSWFGALVLTLQAAIVYLSIEGCLRVFGAKRLGWIGFIPPLLFLAIYSKYRHYSVAITSFTVGLVFSWLWLRMASEKPRWRAASAVVIVGCLYAAAPSALLVFLPLAVLFEMLHPASWLKLLLWVGLSSLVPWQAGAALFGFAPGEAYAKLLPIVWTPQAMKTIGTRAVIALYLIPLFFCLAIALWTFWAASKRSKDQDRSKAPATPGLEADEKALERGGKTLTGSKARVWRLGATIVLALVPLVVVFFELNPKTKATLTVDYLAWHGRWPEVFAAAKGNARNPVVACTVAQASYHTGTLTLKLPSLTSPADLMLSGDRQQSHWKKSDLYFDLGYLNMALHHLTESMEFYGERPVLLQRLALVNLALTNISTAKVYLGTLARAPFQWSWARSFLDRLQADPTLASDGEINRLRQLMVRRDSVVSLSPDEELQMLLTANPQNRMAFEYLMTYYLLTKNLQAFVKNISRVKEFPGLEISPLWDEALLLASLESGRAVQVPGHAISPEARARVVAVTRVIQQHGDNAELSRRELAANYGDTYSFYWCFDR
jgi:hypothetical protein